MVQIYRQSLPFIQKHVDISYAYVVSIHNAHALKHTSIDYENRECVKRQPENHTSYIFKEWNKFRKSDERIIPNIFHRTINFSYIF